ncbi:EAL domain-containing protein [Mesobacillus persicus]|uniref:EAL domain-containing protein n=1 Tax=Mesobacillus persicus TaxID=930146 RepID=A0A1H7ZN63_9BACI|nr:EAL domain-containing protein [Mesobacillus persicus]SEM59830.1 EAL domain-containing protein [Mesobacillus persicus]
MPLLKSLSYIKRLPINCLKIDKNFIQDIQPDLSETEIAETIINLAKSLRLEVVAEGVELEHQKDFLLSRNCTNMQGYLFRRPLPAEKFEHFLKQCEKGA